MLPVKKPSPVECAYAAGLFDGEGHIAIAHRKPSTSNPYERHMLYVSMSQNDAEAINWLVERWGGSARQVIGRRTYDQGFYKRFNWCLPTAAAVRFLRDVRPYLIIKDQEADIAFAFQTTMDPKRRTRPKADVLAFRAQCFVDIRAARQAKKQ